jgi:phosphoheptose isomerase
MHIRVAATARSREVLFEFSAIGNSVKVCAIDPVTMREVSIIGPVTAGEEALKRAALQKLNYVLDGPRLVTVDGRRQEA